MSNEELKDFCGAKVLVCDDDPTYLMLMRDTLEAEGFVVYEAADGDQAILQFEHVIPDIVLLDVEMPGLSGYQVCERIRDHKKGHDVPILMVTGADDYQSILKAYDIGATDFLPKPIRWPMIGHRVRYMLRSQNAVSDLKESQDRLKYLAYYDSLTGLPNRQNFNEHLERFLLLANRGEYHVGVLFIDLDRFKRINDTLGHNFGDKVLKKIAKILDSNIRNCDLIARSPDQIPETKVARLGGDEFTVFLSRVDSIDDIAQVAQRIIEEVSEPIMIEQYEVSVTPSIGISVYPNDGHTVTNLMKNADVAMYHAKEQGRSCFKFYSDSLNSRAKERLHLEQALRGAIENDEFELYYQPQMDTRDSSIAGVEALIRWNNPKLGIVSPAEFIPVAEETGMIIKIGEWVLRQACFQAKQWLDKGFSDFQMSINLSAVQFKRGTLVGLIQSVLKNTGLPPQMLKLEITESAVMTDVEENIVRLQQIKTLGVGIAVDDFGTGYSSLSYLKKFPIDTLKIDRSFIADINRNNDIAIVKAILALAESLGLDVVAEGVENQEQLRILNENNCFYIQGYLFSKPLDAQSCEALLINDRVLDISK
ncbi:EAL domain-containing protein [Thalassotalea crassostreae]|uniref:two-component system response regulator n=1 Tax=Thalassotalea crassostreae TaxID=1763536 RepID=UPI0008390BA7|nr:EAL domain-containing protein [Thalassotalea crassostreae]